jgi:TIR domain
MTLEAYFSHSWKPADVPLNVLVWEVIAEDCKLYVDLEGALSGTYYINRIEELIRKSDVFVSVLTFRKDAKVEERQHPDYHLRCSPAALFELRLAERARKPRWVLFDDRIGLQPPPAVGELVRYTPIDTGEELTRDGPAIRPEGMSWLQSVRASLNTMQRGRSRQAALLIDDTRPDTQVVSDLLGEAVRDAGFSRVQSIRTNHTDAEVVSILQSSGLLVAEVGPTAHSDVYGMAHAMFVPTIRFVYAKSPLETLPRLLEGHPGGYQHDLIVLGDLDDPAALAKAVHERAEAMRDQRKPIEGVAAGCAYFRNKLYRQHNVFFSHNLSPADADFLEQVFQLLEGRGIKAWEYRNNNRSGVIWRDELALALDEATDAVFILDQGFELSEACTEELDTLLRRSQSDKPLQRILPFFWHERNQANPKLKPWHHDKLPSDKTRAAKFLVDQLEAALRQGDASSS